MNREKVIKEYKISVIGDSGVGKSSFVQHLLHNQIPNEQELTTCSEINDLEYKTNLDSICFRVWESTLPVNHLTKFDGIIIIFDINNKKSFEQLPKFLEPIKKYHPNTPVAILGNKIDTYMRIINSEQIPSEWKRKKCKYFNISAKTGFNCKKSLGYILQQCYNIKVKI